jgi:hypothetical protein
MSVRRRVAAGDSIGHFTGVAGTLGVAVTDTRGNLYGLTCGHVAAPWWLVNDRDPIESPADDDGKAGPNRIGTLAAVVPLEPSGVNTVDAALVHPDPMIDLTNASLGLAAGATFSSLSFLDYVGRRDGLWIHTHRGVVEGTMEGAFNDLVFDLFGRLYRFSNVLSYRADVVAGDSGSAVLSRDRTTVLGLHFAGETAARLGYCILASKILEAFRDYGLRIPTGTS